VGKPQVFDDQEQERVFERVAAVDVAKASGVVCMRLPHPAQRAGRRSQVWEVRATMHAVTELAGRLAAEGVQKVTWSPPRTTCGVRVLESSGRHRLEVRLMSRV
jgi:transposase